MSFDGLPVDLIAEILGTLDLESLITMSYLSKRFLLVASDPSFNPWRKPIMRHLRNHNYSHHFKHLSVRTTVPRQNWIDILAIARPAFILFEATIPNLTSSEWEQSFKRRFLPSWQRWKKDSPWKEAFIKIWHRSISSCRVDETWTKFIVLGRHGAANEHEVSSRNYSPLAVFDEFKLQSNLSHLETRAQLVVEFSDVQIIALGTLDKPRTNFTVNTNAHIFMNPPGIKQGSGRRPNHSDPQNPSVPISDHGVYPMSASVVPAFLFHEYNTRSTVYSKLTLPQPSFEHECYPFFTPGGGDLRWVLEDEIEELGLHWVGNMMIIAKLLEPAPDSADVLLSGRHQYASFSWADLWCIAPWLEERISMRIDGAGLGN